MREKSLWWLRSCFLSRFFRHRKKELCKGWNFGRCLHQKVFIARKMQFECFICHHISCLTRSTSDQLEMRQACPDSPTYLTYLTGLADLLDLVGLADLVSLANLTDLTYLTNQQPGCSSWPEWSHIQNNFAWSCQTKILPATCFFYKNSTILISTISSEHSWAATRILVAWVAI